MENMYMKRKFSCKMTVSVMVTSNNFFISQKK